MAKSITYVGLDVHKDTIAVALAEAGLRGEVRQHGKILNTSAALKALTVKLALMGRDLRFCYEAGPCGYGIQRQLAGMGHDCAVVAPSLIPRKPGERIKTDRRDASNLAKLHRAGELTPVWVPDQAHEAIRDLVRARQAAVRTLRQARQQLSGLPAASGLPLPSAGLDAVASAVAGKSQVRAGCASHRAGRLHSGRRGGDGTA
jgi:transposase